MRRPFDENEEISRRQAIALTGTSVLGILLASCGSGGTNPMPDPISSPNPTPSPNVVLQPNTHVIPADNSVTISNITDSGLVLVGIGVPSLAPGNIIVSAAGQGVLRKVTAVSTLSDGRTQVQTQQATLEDAFQEAQFTYNQTIQASAMVVTPMVSGVTVVGRSRGRDVDLAAVNLNFAGVKVEDGGVASIELSGNLSLTLSLDIDVSIRGGKLQYARFLPKVKDTLSLTLTGKIAKEFTKKLHTVRVVGQPIPIAPGFVLVPVLDLYTEFTGGIEIGAEVTSSVSLTLGAGAEYTRGQGWKVLTLIEKNTDLTPKTDAYFSLSLGYTPVLPEFTLLLDGLVGPYFNGKIPQYKAEFKAIAGADPGMQISANADFSASAGFRAEILGFEIARVDYPSIISEKVVLFDRFFPAGGGVSVGVK
jgi:hypothetical protein